MRRAGSGIVVTRRQAELSLCSHFHAMRPSRPPPGGLTAPCTRSRANQIKPRNQSNGSPKRVADLSPVARSLISPNREHPTTLFHSQPALINCGQFAQKRCGYWTLLHRTRIDRVTCGMLPAPKPFSQNELPNDPWPPLTTVKPVGQNSTALSKQAFKVSPAPSHEICTICSPSGPR